jgi:NTE family protein
MNTHSKKTVSLVLGSGGARGLTHIGVINWLEANNFEIKSVAGSSMGALIGGIYAAGKLDEYTEWVTALEKTDVVRYLDLSFGTKGLFKGERIIEALKKLVGDRNIEDLPIAFTAIATEIETEKEVWLSKGSLFNAIRASIAMPGVFTPFKHNGRLLLDGGLVNPIPIAPTFSQTSDLTIAVNLHGRPEPKASKSPIKTAGKPPADSTYRDRIANFFDEMLKNLTPGDDTGLGLFDILARSFDSVQNIVVRFKLAAYSPDVIIDIPRNICMSYEYYRAKELIEYGERKAAEILSGSKNK